jgi:hypothetical protein
MRKNVSNVNLAPIEVDRSNKPILVATNVEDNPIANLISRWKRLTQISKTSIASPADHLKPTKKRRPTVGMLLPK